MANEAELARMVVRIVGDNADYQRKLQQSTDQTKKAGKEIEAAGSRFGNLFKGLGRLAGRGFGPLGGIAGAAAGGGAAGLGVITGLGLVANELRIQIGEWHRSNQAANQAFGTIATGARTSVQALRDVRRTATTEGLQEVVQRLNPEGFRQRMSGWRDSIIGLFTGRDSVEVALDRVKERADRAREALEAALRNPAVRTEMARQRWAALREAVTESSAAYAENAERVGMSTGVTARLQVVQETARRVEIGRAEATRRLTLELEEMAKADQAATRNRLDRERLRGLREQLQLTDLVGGAQARLAETFRTAHDENVAASVAARRYARELAEVERVTDEIEAVEFTKGLRDQVLTFGLAAEQAQLLRLRMRGVSETTLAAASANVELLRALRALQQPIPQVVGARLGSAEARRQALEDTRQFELMIRTAAGGVVGQGQGLIPGIVGARAGSAEDARQRAAGARSIQLLEQIARNTHRTPIAAAAADMGRR